MSETKGAVYLGDQLVTLGTVGSDIKEIPWGNIKGDIENQTDLMNKLAEKQNTLVAGSGIEIDSETNTITSNPRLIVKYWEGQ